MPRLLSRSRLVALLSATVLSVGCNAILGIDGDIERLGVLPGGGGGGVGGAGVGGGGDCTAPEDCPATGSACIIATCEGGSCGQTDAANGTPCDEEGGNVCQDGGCIFSDKAANGTPCSAADECYSMACSDEVCCDTSCTGACESCVARNTYRDDGQCNPVRYATDPDGDCATPELCGEGACERGLQLVGLGSNQSGDEEAADVAVDATGNVYVVGNFDNEIDFGCGVKNKKGARSAFVVKLDTLGNCKWSRVLGGDASDETYGSAIAVGSASIAVVGSFTGALSDGTVNLLADAERDGFVVSLNAVSGTPAWGRHAGNAGPQRIVDVAFSASQDVVIGGDFLGTLELGSSYTNASTKPDCFAASISANGSSVVWTKHFPSTGACQATGLSIEGNAVMTGIYDGTVTLDMAYTANADEESFVVGLGPSGGIAFAHSYGTTGNTRIESVFADSADVLMTGSLDGTVDFNGTMLSSGSSDAFQVATSAMPSPSTRFAEAWSATSIQNGVDIANGKNGLAIIGSYAQTLDLGGGDLPTAAGANIFVVRNDSGAGNHVWSHGYGQSGEQWPAALAINPSGELWIVGGFNGTISFGNDPISSSGDDAFIVKLSP